MYGKVDYFHPLANHRKAPECNYKTYITFMDFKKVSENQIDLLYVKYEHYKISVPYSRFTIQALKIMCKTADLVIINGSTKNVKKNVTGNLNVNVSMLMYSRGQTRAQYLTVSSNILKYAGTRA